VGQVPAEEHEAAGAVHDRLVGHEALPKSVGNRGTTCGRARDVAVHVQAICSVVQTGGAPPAAATIFLVTSPTRLMSRLVPAAGPSGSSGPTPCLPGG
jgi:hypothetical protein